MKIRSVGAEFFHAKTHGWTDGTMLIVAFRNFANTRKMITTVRVVVNYQPIIRRFTLRASINKHIDKTSKHPS